MEMEGDPAIPVIVDTWMKGFRDFDVEAAYQGMIKSATTPGKDNPVRPDIDEYIKRGYCPMESQYDNSVSHALEYYVADYALSTFAKALGHQADAERFYKQSMGYKNYYSKEYGTLRPITQEGKFYEPFNPKEGENFEPSPGFHEGNAWNYTYYVPHDIPGLAKLMGGSKKFVANLQNVFDSNNYDPANEPDIAYPYLFSKFKGEEWRTQKLVKELLAKHFVNEAWGIPGNDDTGTMSCWMLFSMMGFYPDCPGVPYYTLTTPTFKKVTIHLDTKYYDKDKLVIETEGTGDYIQSISLGGKKSGYRVSHQDLIKAGGIKFTLSNKH
jgi:predicted alpha-1,2-mannosidase